MFQIHESQYFRKTQQILLMVPRRNQASSALPTVLTPCGQLSSIDGT